MAKLELPKSIRSKITDPIPDQLIQQRDGGRGVTLSYLSGSTVTDMLNNMFNYMWDWEVEKEWIQESAPFFNTYSKIPESQKSDYNGKKGAWEDQAPVAHVKGRLVVHFVDDEGVERTITKTGFGSKSVIGKQSEQESVFKAAGTDALKKAASLLGIGLELYRNEEEQEYFLSMNYEDPWTDEMREQYKTEREFLVQFMTDYELDEEAMASYVSEFSEESLESLHDIVPDNIESFVAYLQQKIEDSKEK